jgi:beta-fructofuranosidase
MLTTAGSIEAASRQEEAVMGIATSEDLINWEIKSPLGLPGQGFGETEVFQFEVVDGVPILLFCCSAQWLSKERLANGEIGGVYSMSVKPDLTDVDFNRAVLFPDTSLYASRLVQDQDGGWNLIAFLNNVVGASGAGEFIGELCDPIPVTADPVKGLLAKPR